MHVKGFGDQQRAHHGQKRQCQHFDGRMVVYKFTNRLGGKQHHAHRRNHGGHHHVDVVHHANRGDDGVK